MAANLPELYKNNVGPVGYRQEKERDVLYTALMPLNMRNNKEHISVMLVQQYFILQTRKWTFFFPQIDWQHLFYKQ